MLRPILKLLEGRKIVLASGSLRRKNILEHVVRIQTLSNIHTIINMHVHQTSQGFPIDIVPSTFEENLDKSSYSAPWQYAVETARGKANEVAERLKVA